MHACQYSIEVDDVVNIAGLDMQLQVINSSSLMVTWSAPMVNSSYAPITGYKLLNSHIGAMHNDTEHKVIILGPTEKKYILGQLGGSNICGNERQTCIGLVICILMFIP